MNDNQHTKESHTMSDDILQRAKDAIALWDKTCGVEIEITYGLVAARQAYYDAPEMIAELVTEVERLRESLGIPESDCHCWACNPKQRGMRMFLCPKCGNKRCPHSTHHDNACTGSNDSKQPGSRYGGIPLTVKEEERAQMIRAELRSIRAERNQEG